MTTEKKRGRLYKGLSQPRQKIWTIYKNGDSTNAIQDKYNNVSEIIWCNWKKENKSKLDGPDLEEMIEAYRKTALAFTLASKE